MRAYIQSWISQLPEGNRPDEQEYTLDTAELSSEIEDFEDEGDTVAAGRARYPSRPRKLSRFSSRLTSLLPSPPPSAFTTTSRILEPHIEPGTPPPSKRRKTDGGGTNAAPAAPIGALRVNDNIVDDVTPRPGRTLLFRQSDSASSLSMTSTTTSSSKASPRKKMAALQLDPEGIEMRPLMLDGENDLPGPLAELIRTLDPFGSGIISREEKAALDVEPKAPNLPDFYFDDPAVREKIGSTPPIDAVLDIISLAKECDATGQSEHGWNCAVHFPLLQRALHGPSIRERSRHVVQFASCTSAKIIKQYLPTPSSGKMVDFCMFLSPSHPDVLAAIERLRAIRPLHSINHTDFEPLTKGPISISIETKKPTGNSDMANLQIGTWGAAQWRSLTELAGSPVDGSRATDASTEAGQADGIGLALLPALIVQGHDWSIAATSREGMRTILWAKYPIGSTHDVLGVYRIFYAIQQLACWSRDTFLPWFTRCILLLDDLA